MASGLSYAHFFIEDNVVLLVLLSLITVGYALICLYTSQEFQLKVAKLLTMVFALLMAYVTVGVAAQAGDDLYKREHPSTPAPTTPSLSTNFISKSSAPTTLTTVASLSLAEKLPADVSSLYLLGLIGIFALAAFLHLTEAYCLIHGIWYLFCLPSGYLLLIIYSICNITDRSWGKYVGCYYYYYYYYYYYFNLYSFFIFLIYFVSFRARFHTFELPSFIFRNSILYILRILSYYSVYSIVGNSYCNF